MRDSLLLFPLHVFMAPIGANLRFKKKVFIFFYIHGSVHRESNLTTVQQDATYSVYYISVGSSTCFGCQHPKHVELPTEI